MMKAKGLPTCFRAKAVAKAVYILNLSCTRVVCNQMSYEAWIRSRPMLSHLKVFVVQLILWLTYSQKFDEKYEKYIFFGYSSKSKAYKLYNPFSDNIIISMDVVFHEGANLDWGEEQV